MSDKTRIITALIIASIIHASWVYVVNSRFIANDPEPIQFFLGLFLGSGVGTIAPMIAVFLFLYLTKMGFKAAYYMSIVTFSALMGFAYVGHFRLELSTVEDSFVPSLIVAIGGIFLILWIFTKPENTSPIENTDVQDEGSSSISMADNENIFPDPPISDNDRFKAKFSNASETKICPFCAEEVKIKAIKCKHCQSDISHTVEHPN